MARKLKKFAILLFLRYLYGPYYHTNVHFKLQGICPHNTPLKYESEVICIY